jgi:uncharacterized protein (DUF488 family)
MLQAFGVKRLIDIRTVPRSRHNPQFNFDSLPDSLHHAKIAYTHMKDLGGLRHARPDSLNIGWHNASFRGFEKLIDASNKKQVAIMCAEAVPWRCHRSLIADALTARGIEVKHIMSATRASPHSLTPFAKVEGTHVTYPATDATTSEADRTPPFRQLPLKLT